MLDQYLFGGLISIVLITVSVAYWRGWQRLRSVLPGLATRLRLTAFALSMIATFLALVWPMHGLSSYFLIARTLEKVLLVMIAAPLFWLSSAFHIITWGVPTPLRKHLARLCFRSNRFTPGLRSSTQPGVVWFLFLASFLIWHDSSFVALSMTRPLWRTTSVLWLFSSGLLFWGQMIGTAPKRLATQSSLVRLGCLLLIEVPNVATGMYIAFHQYPIYRYYEVIRANNPTYFLNSFSLINDQGLSGALNWIFGSLVYFGSFVLVLNSAWRGVTNSSQPQPPINWDADEKFIMPGLEGRLNDPK